MRRAAPTPPYSQYGLGELSEQSGSFSRGMNGLAYGLRLNNQVNALNPASYSALDSLSFIFDAGVSLQMTQFKEGGRSISARNADLGMWWRAFACFAMWA